MGGSEEIKFYVPTLGVQAFYRRPRPGATSGNCTNGIFQVFLCNGYVHVLEYRDRRPAHEGAKPRIDFSPEVVQLFSRLSIFVVTSFPRSLIAFIISRFVGSAGKGAPYVSCVVVMLALAANGAARMSRRFSLFAAASFPRFL